MNLAQCPIDFRPLVEADIVMLHEWIHRPHVAAWWAGGPPSSVEETARSLRSSIWRQTAGGWKMLFHQGTLASR